MNEPHIDSNAFDRVVNKIIIYKITNKINNKLYVGFTSKSIDERVTRHIQESKNVNSPAYNYILKQAIRKHGIDNFHWEVIEEMYNVTFLYAGIRENFWIEYHKSYLFEFGYNMNRGLFPPKYSEETKHKMRTIRDSRSDEEKLLIANKIRTYMINRPQM